MTIALASTDRLKYMDLSENDIGSTNFKILIKIFKTNQDIELLNVADCKVSAITLS